jgi:hypothetical protein
MPELYQAGTAIELRAGHRVVPGVIREVYHDRVVRHIRGEKIIRHGRETDPAYLIEREDGRYFLKLHSELQRMH